METNLGSSIVLELQNRTVTKAKKGLGSFLLLDLCRSDVRVHSKEIQVVKLWVYLCDWRLTNGSQVTTSSDSISASNAEKINAIVGLRLESVLQNKETGDLVLNFDSDVGLSLTDRPDVYGPEADMLMVYFDEAHVATYQAATGFQNTK